METLAASNWTRWNETEYEPKFHQFWFERVDIDFWYYFAETYMNSVILLAVLLYHGSMWKLSKFMKEREPYQLRIPLFIWNAFIGAFSIVGLHRVTSELIFLLSTPDGFYRSICLREGLHMSTVYWCIVLLWTKPLFMLDTTFLLLRKKKVDAVHMIHHTLAIICGPHLAAMGEPIMRWIGFCNLLVHSIDYPLLAIRSLNISVPKSRHIMAALEVAQMLFVLILSAYTIYMKGSGSYCVRHPTSVMITYGLYCGLLLMITLTLLSPEYWKRGTKKLEISTASKEEMKKVN